MKRTRQWIIDGLFVTGVATALTVLALGIWDNLQDPSVCWTSC